VAPSHIVPSVEGDGPLPAWVALIGAVSLLLCAGSVAALVPASAVEWRFGVIAVAVAIFSALTRDWRIIPIVVAMAWLVVTAFLLGPVVWHGFNDAFRAGLLVLAGCLGQVAGLVGLRAARRRGRPA
jgi:hypothetical protein